MRVTRRTFIKESLRLGGALVFSDRILNAAEDKDRGWIPAYAILENEHGLALKVEQAYTMFEECRLCPRQCGVNRLRGEKGFCQATSRLTVYSAHPHLGEEVSLVGKGGSGTIFFSNCNLRCVFCQNWPIAHEGRGRDISDKELANIMLYLQKTGCHNINLVTPTHIMPNILNATRMAFMEGLRIPLVYNTSGYERIEILKILDGIIDIYLPDMKFMDAGQAEIYLSGASNYPQMAKEAIIEMNRQVGLHQINPQGFAIGGLMLRHLVMPNRVAGSRKFVRWVAANLPKSTYVNIMHQYHVDYKAYEYPEIRRSITAAEFLETMESAEKYGLTNLDPKSIAVRDFFVRHKKKK